MGNPERGDEKFVSGGLINPTIYIPEDATVTVTFASASAGMPHAFEITAVHPLSL